MFINCVEGGYMSKAKKTKTKKWELIIAAIALVITAVVVTLIFTSSFSVKLAEDKIEISDLFYSMNINYSDIDIALYKTEWVVGSRVNGTATSKISCGNFKNNDYDNYKLYINNQVKSYIYVKLKDNTVIVFNSSTTDETWQMYKQLLAKMLLDKF